MRPRPTLRIIFYAVIALLMFAELFLSNISSILNLEATASMLGLSPDSERSRLLTLIILDALAGIGGSTTFVVGETNCESRGRVPAGGSFTHTSGELPGDVAHQISTIAERIFSPCLTIVTDFFSFPNSARPSNQVTPRHAAETPMRSHPREFSDHFCFWKRPLRAPKSPCRASNTALRAPKRPLRAAKCPLRAPCMALRALKRSLRAPNT